MLSQRYSSRIYDIILIHHAVFWTKIESQQAGNHIKEVEMCVDNSHGLWNL